MSEYLSPPFPREAEQSVIGGLILDNRTFDELVDRTDLRAADFYSNDHRLMFAAISELIEENTPCDLVTVSDKIKRLPNISDPQSVLAYLAEIAQATPSTANIVRYAEIVKEHSKLRTLMQIGLSCSRLAAEKNASVSILETVEQQLFALSQGKSRDFVDINASLKRVVASIQEHFESGETLTGVTTGLEDLDKLTGGLQPGDLVIVAGRPSMGKTAFALGIALSVLIKHSTLGAQVYSLEMPEHQIMYRMIGQLATLSIQSLRTGTLTEDDFSKLSHAIATITQFDDRLVLDDTSALTPTLLRAKARRAARKFGAPGIIVVDYLQLMRANNTENRNLEITEISASLKALAKEMECPVIALSQLNRGLEQRANKRPVMADLRESGAIEQDADLILFIYRDEVYNPESSDKGTAELILAKHRNGPTGNVRCTFLPQSAKFANYSSYSFGGGQ